VDADSGLVRQAEMTSANVHEARKAEALIQGDEEGYFADKAYDSQALRETLRRRGIVDGVAIAAGAAIRYRPGSGGSTSGPRACAPGSSGPTPR